MAKERLTAEDKPGWYLADDLLAVGIQPIFWDGTNIFITCELSGIGKLHAENPYRNFRGPLQLPISLPASGAESLLQELHQAGLLATYRDGSIPLTSRDEALKIIQKHFSVSSPTSSEAIGAAANRLKHKITSCTWQNTIGPHHIDFATAATIAEWATEIFVFSVPAPVSEEPSNISQSDPQREAEAGAEDRCGKQTSAGRELPDEPGVWFAGKNLWLVYSHGDELLAKIIYSSGLISANFFRVCEFVKNPYWQRAVAGEQLREENERLKVIIATHDLCHDLHGKVDARAFADGCAQEQRKLYGCAPDGDLVAPPAAQGDK